MRGAVLRRGATLSLPHGRLTTVNVNVPKFAEEIGFFWAFLLACAMESVAVFVMINLHSGVLFDLLPNFVSMRCSAFMPPKNHKKSANTDKEGARKHWSGYLRLF